jgi:hypothetical protein
MRNLAHKGTYLFPLALLVLAPALKASPVDLLSLTLNPTTYNPGVPEQFLTRLHTPPARSPVSSSTLLLRTVPHDSGPMRVATSHSYDFCIHYTSPV